MPSFLIQVLLNSNIDSISTQVLRVEGSIVRPAGQPHVGRLVWGWMKQACEHGKVEHGSESAVVGGVSVVGSGVVEGVTLQGGFTKLSCRFEKQHKLIDLKTGTQNLKVIAWSGCVALFTCEMRNSPLILIDNHLSIFTMILVYICLLLNNAEKLKAFTQSPKIAKHVLKISKNKANGFLEEATHGGNIIRECVSEICDYEEYSEGKKAGWRARKFYTYGEQDFENLRTNPEIQREYTNLQRGLMGYDWMKTKFCEIDPCDKIGTNFCTEIWNGRVCSCKRG